MSFVSPGRLYIQKQKEVLTYESILAFADFLRSETGLGDTLPLDIDRIFTYFQIPEPSALPLPNQQGLLLDAERGIIIINANDSDKRQKFTKAHELVEMLFAELPQGKDLGSGWRLERPGGYKVRSKEALCNWTAANLLMPPSYVGQEIKNCGVNFECARRVASRCDVSLSAALVQLARNSPEHHFVVLWRMKNKPIELRNQPNNDQMTMFNSANTLPEKKLRVEWCLGGEKSPFIPQDKSAGDSSLVYQAWVTNAFTSGRDRMTFDNRNSSWYTSENMPFTTFGEKCVISLIKKG